MRSVRSFLFCFLVLIGSIAFTACNPKPLLVTTEVSAITQTSATSGGRITSDAGSSVTERGVCWSTNANPTIADNKTIDGGGIGSFTSSIRGLAASTTYFVRAYATTSSVTGYGGAYQITTTVANPTVTDIDGNVYHSVNIGTQTWMVENLKTTKYNDGSSIPNVTDDTTWSVLSTPAYCWYNNDATMYKKKYGALYNWYAVNTSMLAPTGWHVPTDAEWTTLNDYVTVNFGTSLSIAKALAATTDWTIFKTIGTIGCNLTLNNYSGFSALPSGNRFNNYGTFQKLGYCGYWWSATDDYTDNAWAGGLFYGDCKVYRSSFDKICGFSVRCVRDSE